MKEYFNSSENDQKRPENDIFRVFLLFVISRSGVRIRLPAPPSKDACSIPLSAEAKSSISAIAFLLFILKPLRWVSAGALLGEVIKLPFCIFSAFLCGGGITTLRPLCLCRNNPARGLFQQKKRLSQSGCSAPTNALFTLAHSAFSAFLHGGWYHYPRRALHAVETLDAHGSRRRICRFCAAAVLALCGQNISSSGTHATPAPNRAHSGSHAETRRVLRVDGDGVFGSGIIDPIDPFQADQTVAVALAEGHRDAVSP